MLKANYVPKPEFTTFGIKDLAGYLDKS